MVWGRSLGQVLCGCLVLPGGVLRPVVVVWRGTYLWRLMISPCCCAATGCTYVLVEGVVVGGQRLAADGA